MEVNVKMSVEEFQEFCQYRSDKAMYAAKVVSAERKLENMAEKVYYAVEPDPKKAHKYKIVDHDHMDDLYEYAGDILAAL